MTTPRQLTTRTKRAAKKMEKAARLFIAALDEFDEELKLVDEEGLDMVDEEFALEDVLGEKVMPMHSPYVGHDCWSGWEQGDELYQHVAKLLEALEEVG